MFIENHPFTFSSIVFVLSKNAPVSTLTSIRALHRLQISWPVGRYETNTFINDFKFRSHPIKCKNTIIIKDISSLIHIYSHQKVQAIIKYLLTNVFINLYVL